MTASATRRAGLATDVRAFCVRRVLTSALRCLHPSRPVALLAALTVRPLALLACAIEVICLRATDVWWRALLSSIVLQCLQSGGRWWRMCWILAWLVSVLGMSVALGRFLWASVSRHVAKSWALLLSLLHVRSVRPSLVLWTRLGVTLTCLLCVLSSHAQRTRRWMRQPVSVWLNAALATGWRHVVCLMSQSLWNSASSQKTLLGLRANTATALIVT